MSFTKSAGARYSDGGCEFRVWAPELKGLSVRLFSDPAPHPMTADAEGYFSVRIGNVKPGEKYVFRFPDGGEHPDPYSNFQPDDVHGPSCVVDHTAFKWRDRDWSGLPLESLVIYELHTGTFSESGTFDGVRSKLPYLRELGVNAVELMPVAQFPGERNWGYDGVYPFAVQNSYGGPDALKTLVDECHALGLCVVLDVVYNHLGPEGNYLPAYMPCFTERYRTPWGKAMNYDDAYSPGVRELVIRNALFWFEHYHMDALRLDAVHGIFDMGARHILRELAENVSEFNEGKSWKRLLIAESDLNDVRVLRNRPEGHGIDAQWNDDFHHCVHTVLTGETRGYYGDFGRLSQLAKAVKEGFVYSWDYSKARKRFHGSSSAEIADGRFVAFTQNHDQVGNRMKGERLCSLVPFEALKTAACLLLLSSNIPLLFMGEEFAEDAPFLYFMSFHDEKLIAAVREGRKKEFAAFNWEGEPDDPYDRNTFLRSKLRWEKLGEERRSAMLALYKELIRLRRALPAVAFAPKNGAVIDFNEGDKTFSWQRAYGTDAVLLLTNFGPRAAAAPSRCAGHWSRVLDTSDGLWAGPGSRSPAVLKAGDQYEIAPLSAAVYRRGSPGTIRDEKL